MAEATRILVVDDLEPNVRLLEAVLGAQGYEVVTAASGEAALARVAEGAPDLVLLDIQMPGIDGYEVCRRLRADPATSFLPIVMVTSSEGEDRVAALTNAVKFTPSGGQVTLGARVADAEVVISVADTGVGMSQQDQARLFEEFYQVGPGSTQEGTGLGLALTRRLVELHGGTIHVESAPGAGSTFTVTLPARKSGVRPSAEMPPAQEAAPVPTPGSVASPR